jgi:hypothetical protein
MSGGFGRESWQIFGMILVLCKPFDDLYLISFPFRGLVNVWFDMKNVVLLQKIGEKALETFSPSSVFFCRDLSVKFLGNDLSLKIERERKKESDEE